MCEEAQIEKKKKIDCLTENKNIRTLYVNHTIYKQKTKAKNPREYNFQIIVIESVDILTDTRRK